MAEDKALQDRLTQISLESKERLPLSVDQFRILFPEITDTVGIYNRLISMVIDGDLRYQAFSDSLKLMLFKHEALRTGIRFTENEQEQIIFGIDDPEVNDWSLAYDGRTFRDCELDDESLQNHKNTFAQAKFPLDGSVFLSASQLIKFEGDRFLWLFKVHHAVFDGTSQEIFLRQLSQAYTYFCQKKSWEQVDALLFSQLPDKTWQFRNFLELQTQSLAKPLQPDAHYWQQKLANMEKTELSLGIDPQNRSELPSTRGARLPFTLNAAQVQQLEQIGKSTAVSATLFNSVMSIFLLLLHRYTDQSDLCIGTATANRKHLSDDIRGNTIGLLSNTIPLRVIMPEQDISFIDWLKTVKQTIQESINEHSSIQFGEIAKSLNLPNRGGFFNILFIQQTENYQTFNLPASSGLDVTVDESGWGIARFDLALELRKLKNGSYHGFLEYKKDLFAEAAIKRLANNMQVLIKEVCANPVQPISQYRVFTAEEFQQIKKIGVPSSEDKAILQKCLHHLFEEMVVKYENKTAVIFAKSASDFVKINYKTLNERANQLAHYLIERGVKPGHYVGFCMPRSVEILITILAIWKVGGVVMPLDEDESPLKKIASAFAHNHVLIITQTALRVDKLRDLPVMSQFSLLSYDRIDTIEGSSLDEYNKENPRIQVDGKDLAALIFTSGSTGEPKGVICSHGGYSNWVDYLARLKYAISDHVVYAGMPFIFDAGLIWEPFCLALLQGGTVLLVPSPNRLNAAFLKPLFQQFKVNTVTFTPSTFQSFSPEDFAGVPTIYLTAEKLPAAIIKKFEKARLINAFGPTEAHLGVSLNENPNYIGRPLQNRKMYVLDKLRRLVPYGAWGNLYIGGDDLGRYLNSKNEAGRFFSTRDPYHAGNTPAPLIRVFAVGDKMRMLENGFFEIGERTDRIVKRYGRLIDLKGIEKRISEFGLKEVMVKAWGEGQQMYLAAYIVVAAAQKEQLSNDHWKSLKNYLRECGLSYLEMPKVFIALDRLPLTPTGKQNYRALVEPSLEMQQEALGGVFRPESQIEKDILGIWQAVLGLETVYKENSFFETGGNSFLFLSLIGKINQQILFKPYDSKLEQKDFPRVRNSAAIQDFTIGDVIPMVERFAGIYKKPSVADILKATDALLEELDPLLNAIKQRRNSGSMAASAPEAGWGASKPK
jgi:non-ribosomal peptide synthetase component F